MVNEQYKTPEMYEIVCLDGTDPRHRMKSKYGVLCCDGRDCDLKEVVDNKMFCLLDISKPTNSKFGYKLEHIIMT